MIEHIINFIAPPTCLNCGREGLFACHECRTLLIKHADEHHVIAQASTLPLSGVYAVSAYDDHAKALIWKLKFERAKSIAKELAEMMHHALPATSENVLVVHVPTATSRIRLRGYDQSALIARWLAAHRTLPYAAVLTRTTQTRQVGALRRARYVHMQNAFRVLKPYLVQNKDVMLIDDVLTTGASLSAAARALRDAGARSVSAAVFAQGH